MPIHSNDPCQNQTFQVRGQTLTVGIVKSKTGERAAKVTTTGKVYFVPSDLLACCTEKDSWMKNILIRCGDCRKVIKASELECNMCSECYEKAGEENALAG